jgi:cbb3-type cytochrome c oxidase subunit III
MKTRSARLALLLAIVTIGVGSAGRAPGTDYVLPDSLPPGVTPAMVERGYAVFHGEGLCMNCHGADAGGLLGPSLKDSDWWHAAGSYLSILRQVLVGVPADRSLSGEEMPPRGGSAIGEDDVIAVAAFVWRVSHPDETELPLGVTPEIIEIGSEVFHDRGNCADCHGEDATGDEGPNLTDNQWLHLRGSHLAIVNQINKGVPFERSRTGIVMPPRGGSSIGDADVNAVAAYVWVVSRPGE